MTRHAPQQMLFAFSIDIWDGQAAWINGKKLSEL
jgi:hypothetical protein